MRLIHLRNNQVVDDVAKQPSADSLEYGEIAINYKKDKELLFIKNDQDEIVSFLTKDAVNELIIQNLTFVFITVETASNHSLL